MNPSCFRIVLAFLVLAVSAHFVNADWMDAYQQQSQTTKVQAPSKPQHQNEEAKPNGVTAEDKERSLPAVGARRLESILSPEVSLVYQVALSKLPFDGLIGLSFPWAARNALGLLLEYQAQNLQGVWGAFQDELGRQEGGAAIIEFACTVPEEQVPKMLCVVGSEARPLGGRRFDLADDLTATLSDDGHSITIQTDNLPKVTGAAPGLPQEVWSFGDGREIVQCCLLMNDVSRELYGEVMRTLSDEEPTMPVQMLLHVFPAEVKLQIRYASSAAASKGIEEWQLVREALRNAAGNGEISESFTDLAANLQFEKAEAMVSAVWKGDTRKLIVGAMREIAAVLVKARAKALEVSCSNNLKALLLAVILYACDHDDNLPTQASWRAELLEYVSSAKDFECPLSGRHFRYFGDGQKLPERDLAAHTVLFVCNSNHDGQWIVGFADGHVARTDAATVQAVLDKAVPGELPKL